VFIFELGNALAARDLQLSLKLVRRLLDQAKAPSESCSWRSFYDP